MDLNAVFESLGPVVSHHAQLLPNCPAADRGSHIEKLSECFQAYGICFLLLDADADQFREFLTRSACASRYFRQTARKQAIVDTRFLALSRSEAFFDGLVAGRRTLTIEISELCADVKWKKEWEYEEDHYYMRFLMGILNKSTVDQLEHCIHRIVQVEGDNPSARLNICWSLLNREQDLFDDALTALLDEKKEQDDERRPSAGDWDALFWPQSFVSIEGLALLQLASAVGLDIHKAFPLCPVEARIPLDDGAFQDTFGKVAGLAGDTA